MTKTIENSPELTALLNHQQAIAYVKTQLTQLDEAIVAQKEAGAQLRDREKLIADLRVEREDILADIAMGHDKAKELQKLDARLAEQEASLAKKGSQAAVGETIAGLERKRVALDAKLQDLQAPLGRLRRALVKEQAETLGGEYAELALKLANIYGRLTALNNIWVGLNGISFKANNASLSIPALNLDAVAPHAMQFRPHLLATEFGTHAEIVPLIGAEKDSLRAAGIEIE